MLPASADGKREAVSAIPRESGAFLERPKRMGVKRRAKPERPEPALSERKRVSQATA